MQEAIMRTLDFLRGRKRAYQLTFGSPAGMMVLRDLAIFSGVVNSNFDPDHAMQARMEGRREVVLRIQKHLNLTSEQLFDVYNGNSVIKGDQK